MPGPPSSASAAGVQPPGTLGRVVLRPLALTDLPQFAAMHARPEVARYLYWEPRTQEESRAVLVRKMAETANASSGSTSLAVVRAADGALLGEVVLRVVDRASRGGEIGFIFAPEHAGQGYATEAARTLLDLAFGERGLHRVIGRCDARNTASARLLARLGMRREAYFRRNEFVKGEWCDELVYAILSEEWPAARPPTSPA